MEEREVEIRQRDGFVEAVVPAVFESVIFSPGKDDRVVEIVVSVAVLAAVEHDGVVEQGVVALLHSGEFVEEVGQVFSLPLIPFAEFLGATGFVPTVGEGMGGAAKA